MHVPILFYQNTHKNARCCVEENKCIQVEGGETRDDFIGNYHRSLRPEMAEILCLYAGTGAHHGKPEIDNIR